MNEAARSRRRYRCAIYTRKSTEDGLEQEFNSLDAQREACSAFILSQASEGWEAVDTVYSDGGFSGGSIERPALQDLLAALRSGQIDVIVVYKVDRLTRSLADFARLVELMDAHEASFVSVTQSFNTTTSMGRLTLNVLLSFAQFEREVTSERIRDKIAASKKKGMWMGGGVPAGYVVEDRKLMIDEEQAALVRDIFQRYLDLRSVPLLVDALAREGIVSPIRISRVGNRLGGKPFTKGALYHLLQNRIYRGEVSHKGRHFPGDHAALIDRETFDAAQAILTDNRRSHDRKDHVSAPSLLCGRLFDALGRPMSPTRTKRRGRTYRYYASAKTPGSGSEVSWRVPAEELENLVISRLRSWLTSRSSLLELFPGHDLHQIEQLHTRMSAEGAKLATGAGSEASDLIKRWIERIAVEHDRICLIVRAPAEFVEQVTPRRFAATLDVAASIVRSGKRIRLALPPSDKSAPSKRDPSLIKLIAKAWVAREALEGSKRSLAEVAAEAGHNADYFGRLARLGYLAPDIVTAILEGRQPAMLTRQRLARLGGLSLDWDRQRKQLGFS
ncbi:MAG: recombinase family protein [Erythrobacter sp.]|uniref:recombinase family protein n=1 Tax=Erythrobacter sp. TaxID=1042 RepID=UPI003C75745A